MDEANGCGKSTEKSATGANGRGENREEFRGILLTAPHREQRKTTTAKKEVINEDTSEEERPDTFTTDAANGIREEQNAIPNGVELDCPSEGAAQESWADTVIPAIQNPAQHVPTSGNQIEDVGEMWRAEAKFWRDLVSSGYRTARRVPCRASTLFSDVTQKLAPTTEGQVSLTFSLVKKKVEGLREQKTKRDRTVRFDAPTPS